VKFLDRHKEKLDILDADLPRIFSILQEQFVLASGLLEDVETVYFKTPTCYPSRDVDGDEHVTSAADAFGWFRRLFDRLAILRPDLAKAHATTWDSQDPYFFRKLKLYAYGKTHVFEADEASELVLSLDQQTFWDLDVSRELLFLLTDRWLEFSDEMRAMLIDRIFTGPDRRPHWSDEDYPSSVSGA
jgi:hypothetical protein